MPHFPTFRCANTDDLIPIAQLESQALPDPWSAVQIQSEMERSGSVLLVAQTDDGLAGYISAVWVAGELEILRLAVATHWQRQQVATGLVQALIDRYQPQGLERILLEVRADNAGAQAFYRQFAFTTCGRRPGYYADGTDALLMERIIA